MVLVERNNREQVENMHILHLINPQSLVGFGGKKIFSFFVSICQLLEVRFGLISYRDHPPQERTYVTQSHPFTEDVETMRGPLIHPMGYGQVNSRAGTKLYLRKEVEIRFSMMLFN